LKQDLEEKIKAGHVDKVYTAPQGGKEIKHDWLWSRMGGWFNDTDIILTETGTSSFGLTNVPLPPKATYIAQILWGSIGWSVGATLGAALAAKEATEERRTVLFVGDGSLQLVSPLPTNALTVDGPRDRYDAPKRSMPVLIRPQ
jgi:pyruvate decarboxylase